MTGATGGIVLVLLWIYYEAQIILVGAEFTRVVALDRPAISVGSGPETGAATTEIGRRSASDGPA